MAIKHVRPDDPVAPWDGDKYYRAGARCYWQGRTWKASLDICNPAFEPAGLAPYGWEHYTELTPESTRQDYHVRLADSYARSAPYGGNQAILDHLVKVARMSDAAWPAHRAGLLQASGRAVTSGVVAELAEELMEIRKREG